MISPFGIESDVFAVVAGIAILWLLGFAAWGFFRVFERLARWRLSRQYEGLDLRPYPKRGDVYMTYTTFHGFIAWYTPIIHVANGPADQVLRLLGRLFRFNLIWGLLTWASPFYLFGVITFYRRERSEVARQAAAGGFDPEQDAVCEWPDGSATDKSPSAEPTPAPGDASTSDNPYAAPRTVESVVRSAPAPQSPSYVLAFAGVLAMPIGAIILVVAIVNLFRGEFAEALPGLAVGGLIAFTGLSWVRDVWK